MQSTHENNSKEKLSVTSRVTSKHANHLLRYAKQMEKKKNQAEKKQKNMKATCLTTADRKIPSTLPDEVVKALAYNKEEHKKILNTFVLSTGLGVTDASGNTIFHLAALKGRGQLIEYFMQKGHDINIGAKNREEYTPLMVAVKMAASCKKNKNAGYVEKRENYIKVINGLIKYGAGKFFLSDALEIAATYGDLEVFLRLLDKANKKDLIAVYQGHGKSLLYSPSLINAALVGAKAHRYVPY